MRSFLLCTLCVLAFFSSSFTQTTSSLIRNSGDSSNYPHDDLLTIFDSTIVDVQETGLSYVHVHKLIKILTVKGAKELTSLKFDYDAQSAFIEFRKIMVHPKRGKSYEINAANIYDYPAPARMIYWGARQKMIDFGRLAPGDAVEVVMFKKGFTYALLQSNELEDEQYIPPMKGHFYDIVNFWSDHPLILKNYTVSVPQSKSIKYKFYNGKPEIKSSTKGNREVLSFTCHNLRKTKHPAHTVAKSDIEPKLLISTSSNWESKSTWFYGVNEDYGSFETFPALTKKTKHLLKGATNELDSIGKLTHWVADNMRYSGISMGEGEGYTLHNSKMNYTDRCGVCKDKAGLLIAMLRAAGFEAYAAMTMAGSRIDSIPADQFNHCVSVVKLNDGSMKILDPTWVPFVRELWSSLEQQQNYLIGSPEGSGLMETPVSAPEHHYLEISNTAKLSANGDLSGSILIKAEGQSDAAIRRKFTSQAKHKWQQVFESEMLRISDNIEFSIKGIETPYDYSEAFTITITYNVASYAALGTKQMLFTPIIGNGFMKSYMSHLNFDTSLEKREHAFKDRCSRLVTLNETIEIPANWTAQDYEDEKSFEGASISYSGFKNQELTRLNFHQEISLGKRIYERSDWQNFKEAVDFQKSFAGTFIILNKQ